MCLGYSPLRLANGGEDKLHLNDVIISDAASCNQGQGAEREIRREVLYAWIGRRSENAVLFICLLSLPPRLERRRNTKESRDESGAQNKTKDDNEGTVWPAGGAQRASRGEARPPEICVTAVNENFERRSGGTEGFRVDIFEVGMYFRS